jgi:hypothetical protein
MYIEVLIKSETSRKRGREKRISPFFFLLSLLVLGLSFFFSRLVSYKQHINIYAAHIDEKQEKVI